MARAFASCRCPHFPADPDPRSPPAFWPKRCVSASSTDLRYNYDADDDVGLLDNEPLSQISLDAPCLAYFKELVLCSVLDGDEQGRSRTKHERSPWLKSFL